MDVRAVGLRQGACGSDAHSDLAALMALAELVRGALSDRFAPSNACFRAHPVSLATSIGERSMPRQTKQAQARRRLPQQIDLFAGEPKTTTDGVPAWSGLPTKTQAALTDLITRLILDHADSDDGGRS